MTDKFHCIHCNKKYEHKSQYNPILQKNVLLEHCFTCRQYKSKIKRLRENLLNLEYLYFKRYALNIL